MRLLITNRIDQQIVERISVTPGVDVEQWTGSRPMLPDELIEHARGAEAMISMLTDRIDARFLASVPALKIVSNMAVGYDNFDLAAMTRHHVLATNTPDVLTEATAELAIGLILALMRGIVTASHATRLGQWRGWSPAAFLGSEVYGKVLGIVGMGRIGTAVARRATALGMGILALAPRHHRHPDLDGVRWADLPLVLAESDVISLHLPATEETRHLANAQFFSQMKPGSYLINTARGSVVDTTALVAALNRGNLAGAALDVFEAEPLPRESPLWDLPGVLITPHIGSATVETRRAMALRAWQNIDDYRQGRAPRDLLHA